MTACRPEQYPESISGHDGGEWIPVLHKTVASWPAGHFAENIAISESGVVYISLHSHNRVDRYDPATGKVELFVVLPSNAAGLSFDAAGALWITGGAVGVTPGYVWRVGANGIPEEWLEISDAVFMNGCTQHTDGSTLLVCESVTGRIWAVDQKTRGFREWFADRRLSPTNPQMPGANGIKIWENKAFVSVTDSNQIFEIPIEADGTPGPMSLFAENLRADDFAFSGSGNLYIATHLAQSVMKISQQGARCTVAGPREGAVGSTACAFGRTRTDARSLYVTTTGGVFGPYKGNLQDAKLLQLEVAEVGAPLLPE